MYIDRRHISPLEIALVQTFTLLEKCEIWVKTWIFQILRRTRDKTFLHF